MDFGANVWGSHLGVSTRLTAVERDFREMAALGFTVVRWFVFCDGRSGIVYDEEGLPRQLDPHVFQDMDAALELALANGIALCLVLLDHRWMFRGLADVVVDPGSGALLETVLREGRAHVLLERDGQDALFDEVITPLVRRYGHRGTRADLAAAVFAYELMNEPDFVVEEWEQDLSRHVARPMPFDVLAGQVARLSEVVHRESSAATTLAAARLRNLWAWDDPALGVDLLQVHSYPDLRDTSRDEDVYGRAAQALGCAHPILLGEFPGDGPRHHPTGTSPPDWTLGDYLDFALREGYAGAWAWSFSGTDAYQRLPVEPLRRFAASHPELVNPRALV